MASLRPPRAVRWIAERVLCARDREFLIEDLDEEFTVRRAADRSAAAWYLAQAIHAAFTRRLVPSVMNRGRRGSETKSTVEGASLESQSKNPVSGLAQDVRLAVRVLVRDPVFAVVSVLTLAFGIGANLALFSVANAALWQPLPFRDARDLVHVNEIRPDGGTATYTSLLNYSDWRAASRSFVSMAAYTDTTVTLTGAGEPVRLDAIQISASLLPLLGQEPLLGRNFASEEDRRNGPSAVLLSHHLWRERFGGDPGIAGRTLTLDGQSQTIVGVMPQDFQFPVRNAPIDIWLPIERDTFPQMRVRDGRLVHVVARLQPSTTTAQASVEMASIAKAMAQAYPDTNKEWGATVVSLHEDWFGSTRQGLFLLLGAVAFVLLIGCCNLASLILARTVSRQRDMAVRRALGASRARLVRQVMVQSLVVAVVGGSAGVLVSLWLRSVVVSIAPPSLPRVAQAAIDLPTLMVAFGATLMASLLVGIGPAWLTSRDTPLATDRGAAGAARHNQFLRLLLVGEIAGGMVLLAGAGLFAQSFARLMSVNPGFEPSNVLAVPIELSQTAYPDPATRTDFYRAVLERLEALPNVESAAAAFPLPFESPVAFPFSIDGAPTADRQLGAYYRSVSASYFATLRVPLKRGRVFTRDDRASTAPVVVINERMAVQFFPGQNAIGRRITITDRNAGDVPSSREIVGIVGDVRHQGLDRPSGPEMYVPYPQAPSPWMSLAIRGTDAGRMASTIAKEIHAIDPTLPVQGAELLSARIAQSSEQRRFNARLLGAFAISALLLAMLGIAGTTAYIVAQRTPEIAVRIAVGATFPDVLRLILGGTLRIALLGVLIGILTSLALGRTVEGLLFNTSAFDPVILVSVATGMTLLALLAGFGSARRAAKVDPVVALRRE